MSFGVAISSSHYPIHISGYIRITFFNLIHHLRPTESWPSGSQWIPVDPSGSQWIPVDPSGTGHTAASNASPASAPPGGSAVPPPPLAHKSHILPRAWDPTDWRFFPGTSHTSSAKQIQHEKQSNLTRKQYETKCFWTCFPLKTWGGGIE